MGYPVETVSPYGTNAATPNPAYSGVFIPQIWSGKLVEKFYKATVLAAIANTDYEGEIKNQGDTVKIRQRPTILIYDYKSDQDLNVDRPSVATAPDLVINHGKYFNLALDDVMELQADIDMMSIWSEDAAEQMKITIDTEVLKDLRAAGTVGANIDASNAQGSGNDGASAGQVSGNIRLGKTTAPVFINTNSVSTGVGDLVTTTRSVLNWIIDMGQCLDENNIPETGRWLVIPANVAAMIKKSDLKDASLSGDNVSILRNGRLGMIDRFTIYMSNCLPQGTGGGLAAGEILCPFGIAAGLTFASQFTKMETMRSERTFANLLRGLQVYGFQVVNKFAIGRSVIKVGNLQ